MKKVGRFENSFDAEAQRLERKYVRPKRGRCKTQLYDYCIPSCEVFERCENRPGLAGWIIKIKHWLRKLFSGDPLTY